jgi:glutamine synthetase
MSLKRFNAIDIIHNRFDIAQPHSAPEQVKISSFYGENVFNDETMKKYLPEAAYFSVKAAIQTGSNLNKDVAGVVAEAMKKWAMKKALPIMRIGFNHSPENSRKARLFFHNHPRRKSYRRIWQ